MKELKLLVCCVSLFFLSSCTSMTNTAVEPAQLEDLLKQTLVLLPEADFENLPPSLKENEIIFLGESKHYVRALIQAAERFCACLANYRPVVYAMESCYGHGPFMEAASLGNPKTAIPMRIPECIQAFNSDQNADKKILLTAIDIEHSIYHTKSDTVLFLQDLAGRSTSDAARRTLQQEIPQLTAQHTFDKVDHYLKNLKRAFLQHWDTFSSEDRDEISFSLDLLVASNQSHQYTSVQGGDWKNPIVRRGWNIREKYFTKTIERAYRKGQERKAILLCRVGAPHSYLTDKRYQARYFAKKYSPTKGKVASIGLVPLHYDVRKTNDTVAEDHNNIDAVIKTLMEDNEYAYLSLSELRKSTNTSLKWSKYYSTSAPKHDGLLFVRIEKDSGQS